MAEPVAANRQCGQATVETVAAIPALLLIGLTLLQLIATGYTYTLADGAAEAGGLALAAGMPAEPAVRAALPGWARDRVRISATSTRVEVEVRPPSPIAALANRLAVTSEAAIAEGGG